MMNRVGIVALLVLGALNTGCAGRQERRPDELWGTKLPAPLHKVDFTLLDTDGQEYRFSEETEGYVTLLFFGYTRCPDACPIHMANIAAVLKTLAPEVASQVKVVMVTVDPERDDAAQLRIWLDNFDSAFVGLTGEIEYINEIQRMLMLGPVIKESVGSDDYLVGHASQVVAFTRDNLAHTVYSFGTRQRDWAHDIPILIGIGRGT